MQSSTPDKATNVVWHDGEVSREDRHHLLGQKGVMIWFTGLSGSGKSTIAVALEKALHERGHLVYRLDGDNIRMGINRNLGFSAEDRTENIRRIGEIGKLLVDTGVIVLSSFISPYRTDRRLVRQLHDDANMAFIECFVDTPLATAEERDPKGLYKKARAGEIKNFTGIDDPYEAPEAAEAAEAAEITLHSDRMSLQDEVDALLELLTQRGLIKAR